MASVHRSSGNLKNGVNATAVAGTAWSYREVIKTVAIPATIVGIGVAYFYPDQTKVCLTLFPNSTFRET